MFRDNVTIIFHCSQCGTKVQEVKLPLGQNAAPEGMVVSTPRYGATIFCSRQCFDEFLEAFGKEQTAQPVPPQPPTTPGRIHPDNLPEGHALNDPIFRQLQRGQG